MSSPLRKPEGLSWEAAGVELPEMPMIQPGQDAMSMTIAAVLPTMAAQLTANVAALAAKEHTFSGKVVAAQAAYENADQSGSQSVGQLTSMLGQVGQMGQMAGAPAQSLGQLGGQTGMFGQMMQQAMQAAQAAGGGGSQGAGGAGAGGGAPAAGQPATGQGPAGMAAPPQQAREDAPQQQDALREAEREPEAKLERADEAMAGPSTSEEGRQSAGPVPVTPPEQSRYGDGDDVARRL